MAFILAVLACWIVLFAGFVLRKRLPRAREMQRGQRWGAGLLLQGLSIGIVWGFRRAGGVGPVIGTTAVILAAASVCFMLAALRALGRQFAYEARLVEDHKLITAGPYRFVRNPMYTGLYGLTLATAMVYSQWIVIPLFTALFAAGTAIRVRSEERLLRGQFGAEFEAYAARVPAVIPDLRL
jgi:protein-S-isoprenylcysteine O-methyltransferase Ste14